MKEFRIWDFKSSGFLELIRNLGAFTSAIFVLNEFILYCFYYGFIVTEAKRILYYQDDIHNPRKSTNPKFRKTIDIYDEKVENMVNHLKSLVSYEGIYKIDKNITELKDKINKIINQEKES